jgi:hypothetical protein
VREPLLQLQPMGIDGYADELIVRWHHISLDLGVCRYNRALVR